MYTDQCTSSVSIVVLFPFKYNENIVKCDNIEWLMKSMVEIIIQTFFKRRLKLRRLRIRQT